MTVHVTGDTGGKDNHECEAQRARVRHLGTDGGDSQVWLCYPLECYEHLACSADPWIAMFLWPAMKLGQGLHIEAPASPALLESTRALMDIMSCWDASYRPVEVTACGTCPDRAGGRAVASFFSGGVDSFYTAVKHTSVDAPAKSRITHLVSVKGLDVKLGDNALWMEVVGHLRNQRRNWDAPGSSARKRARDHTRDLRPWGMYYGSVLAAIGLGLKGFWNTVMIPAAQSYADLYPGARIP